ncbi:unnamed protein product [Rhizoctonia solani]|nr:unnamed protein product [Rhizoctonia solani]
MTDAMDFNQPSTSNRVVESLQPLLNLQTTVDERIYPLLVSPADDLKYNSSEGDMIKTPSPSPINVSAGTSSVDSSSPPPKGILVVDSGCILSTTALEFRRQSFLLIWEETEKEWVDKFKTPFPYSNDLYFRVKVQSQVRFTDDNPDQSLWREIWDVNREYWSFSKVIARLQEESTRKRVHLWEKTGQYHSQDMELWETILGDDTIRREVQLNVYSGHHISLPQFPEGVVSTRPAGDLRRPLLPRHERMMQPRAHGILDLPLSIVLPSGWNNHGSASDGSAASHVSNVASIKDAICWSPPPSYTAGLTRKRGLSSSSAEYDRSVKRLRRQSSSAFKSAHRQIGTLAGGTRGTNDTSDQEADAPIEHGRSPDSMRGGCAGQQQLDGVGAQIIGRNIHDDDVLYEIFYEHDNHSGVAWHEPLVTSNEESQNELGLPSSDIIGGQDVCIDCALPNQDLPPENSEQLVLYNTPISRKMTTPEVVSHLVAHGCRDLTDALDHSTFGQHPISHGGFSDVYCGHLLDATQVAVKALRISIQSIAENPKHLKHAARELHTWSKCKHPNVLQLLGFAVFRERIAMVSPWMGQGNLHRYLERTPGVNRGSLCIQICEGLSYLHEIEIIHGDLKGANVLISEDGTPVLADFGNSTHMTQSMKFTQTTTERSWTMRWSAPELIIGSGLQSKAADVYALAMTIYEIMTGTLPYNGKLEHTIIYMVTTKKEPPERPCTIPISHEGGNKLWELLLCCWSFEPEARPSAIETATILKSITLDGLAIVISTSGSDLD